MRVHSILGNQQKLDGGAMYGNCPRAVWERWSPPDEKNRITLGCRALLVVDGDKKILFEAGIGQFFEPALRERFGVTENEHVLLQSLAKQGLTHEDIDVVVVSHLHFDHAGGLLSAWSEKSKPELLFPNATFVIGKEAWERGQNPHVRDRASFIPELMKQLSESGRVEWVEGDHTNALDSARYRFEFSNGHTPGLMHAVIATPRGTLTFASDLIPGVPWVHLPITMGYDRFPEKLIEEKTAMIERIRAENGWIFFTHDPQIAASRVTKDEKGKMSAAFAEPEVNWV